MLRIAVLVVFAALTVLLLTACGEEELPFTLAPSSDLPQMIRDEGSANTRKAYQFAAANPEHLKHIPCYCGCNAFGHVNNLQCYIKDTESDGTLVYDMHALHCGVCVDITLDVMNLLKEGKSPGEIRDTIDETYRTVGPPTNTSRPPNT